MHLITAEELATTNSKMHSSTLLPMSIFIVYNSAVYLQELTHKATQNMQKLTFNTLSLYFHFDYFMTYFLGLMSVILSGVL